MITTHARGVSHVEYLSSCLAPVIAKNEAETNSSNATIVINVLPTSAEISGDIKNVISATSNVNAHEASDMASPNVSDENVNDDNVSDENVSDENDDFKDAQDDVKDHVLKEHSKDTQNIPAAQANMELNPICKTMWLGTTCERRDCSRAHPPCCVNPDCLILDQGLPPWRTLQCRNWHGQPTVSKAKKNNNKKYLSRAPKHSRAKRPAIVAAPVKTHWPPLPTSWTRGSSPQAAFPVWLNQNPTQNQWFQQEHGNQI
jgi:hypothetical protein